MLPYIPHGSGSSDQEVVQNKKLLYEELEKPAVHNMQRFDEGRKQTRLYIQNST